MRVAGRTLIACVIAAGLAFAGCGNSSPRSSQPAPGGQARTTSGNPTPSELASAANSNTSPTQPPTQPGSRPVQASPPSQPSRHEPEPSVSIAVSIPGLLGPERQIPKRYTCDGEDISLPVQWKAVPPGTRELAVFVLNLRFVDGSLFFDWGVAGLSPTSRGLSAGALPPGAVVATNSFGKAGYSICPPKGVNEDYIVRVVALRRPLAVRPGVKASALLAQAERTAKVVGIGGGTYARS